MDADLVIQWCLNGERDKIEQYLITDHQREIVLWIYKRSSSEATTSQVAKRFNKSVQSASALLNRLYFKGYLRREQRLQESGGYEWLYFR